LINEDKSTWKATRDGYGKGLVKLGEETKNTVVLSADLTESTRANWFRDEFPERFFSFGVAEQDMMSTAAGFALSQKVPFCCTFGVFATGRAWEQIRVSAAYMNLNINIGGTHGGILTGEDGATHQALEEIALMRILPNMSVVVPSDSKEAEEATVASYSIDSPVYLRLGREKLPIVSNTKEKFVLGKSVQLKEGKDLTVIACGVMVYLCLEAAEILEKEGISVRVVNMHTIKPIDKEAILRAAKDTKAILTAEEHLLAGGLGSAVAEVVVKEAPVPIEMVGVDDRFGESGKPWELMEYFNLMPDDIVAACKRLLNRK